MADPATLALVGAGVSVTGALQSGRNAETLGNYNAQIDEQNAVVARQQAAVDEMRQRRMGRKRTGAIRAAVGASGIQMAGSAMDALADSIMEEELDAATIKYQGELKARGLRQSATGSRFEGQAAKQLSYANAASKVLMASADYKSAG